MTCHNSAKFATDRTFDGNVNTSITVGLYFIIAEAKVYQNISVCMTVISIHFAKIYLHSFIIKRLAAECCFH